MNRSCNTGVRGAKQFTRTAKALSRHREHLRTRSVRRPKGSSDTKSYSGSATAMGLKRTFADDSDMRGIAMQILLNCGGEPRIIRQVQAVMSSNEDVLPK